MGIGSELGRVTRLRRITVTFLGVLVAFSFVLGQAAHAAGPSPATGKPSTPDAAPAAQSTLDGGGVTLDFIAAGPYTYDHTTGVGGAFNDRTISKSTGVVESLEGGDFACGDRVVFFTAITVEPNAGSGSVEIDYTYDGQTTSGSSVGFDDLISASVNTGDSGNENLDGNESVTVNSESFITAGKDRVETSIQVDGVDGGDQIILRMVVELYCAPNPGNVTGNIQSTLDAARVVGGATINSGQQTIPLKQAGNILLPGLNVEKACPASATAGDTITYEITVSNTGQDALEDLTVSDPLLGGELAGFGSTLAAGASVTKSFQYKLEASPDPLVNTVTVTATGAASNASVSDVADCTTDVLIPSLSVVKTADEATVSAGEDIGYTITVTSGGEGAARGVVMSDTLPTNAGLNWSFDQVTGGWTCAIAAGVLTCGGANFNLASGASASVHITSPTTQATCGTVRNSVSVTSSNDGNPTAGPVEIVVNCPVVPAPLGINIDKGGPDLSHVGDVVTYIFAVSLTTGVPLHAVVVTDPNCDAGAPAYVSGDDGDVVLEPGEVWRYTCDHLVTEDDPDPLPNTATVSGTSGDGRTVSDQDDHLVDLIHPDIRILKTVDPPSGEPGDVVTFSYEVRNTGDTTLYDVHVDDDVIGPIGVIGVLEPGETVVLTKEWELPGDAIDIVNVGTASGTDVLGEEVSDDDDAVVTIVEAATPPAPPRPTAFTGSDALSLGALAGLLLFAGLLAITVARRRRDVTA